MQSFIAFSAIVLAIFLNYNFFNAQGMFNVSAETISFYIVMLIFFGFILLIGGLFLVYEWWETR